MHEVSIRKSGLITQSLCHVCEVYFRAPFGISLGHIVCKQGLLVDPTNIALILSLSPPTNVNVIRETLGHTGYYRKFIRGYVAITTSMEKLLKKDATFVWSQECQGSFDTLKTKMPSAPILVFWIGTRSSMFMWMHHLLHWERCLHN